MQSTNEIVEIVTLTLLAGGCIPLGGYFASFARFQVGWLDEELRHFIIALGGGVLLGAVAVVLIPEGMEQMEHSLMGVLIFLGGGVAFFFIERQMAVMRAESPQLMGMLLDFIPESIALGGLLALQSPAAPLLALLIGIQNLPEGFNAYRELNRLNHNRSSSTIFEMCLIAFIGPIAGLLGYFFLSDHHTLLGGIMLFASGGILYLIFQDIAPQSKLNKHWAPPLGAVVGVAFTLLGQLFLGVG
jgi:ZIP family zinc transporter